MTTASGTVCCRGESEDRRSQTGGEASAPSIVPALCTAPAGALRCASLPIERWRVDALDPANVGDSTPRFCLPHKRPGEHARERRS